MSGFWPDAVLPGRTISAVTMTQGNFILGRGRSRRLTGALAWLGTAALVIGGSTTSANAATSTPEIAPLLSVSGETVPGEYIVVLKDGSAPGASGLRSTASPDRVKAAAEHGRKLGAGIKRQFSGAIQGYSADLSGTELTAIRQDPTVAYVQPNRVFRTEAESTGTPVRHPAVQAEATQTKPVWGLDRVDQRNLPRDKKYYATATGAGVTAFIVDTGIAAGQQDLHHVGTGVDVVGDGQGTNDCAGHGTHVSGTVGGGEYGVAKSVTLIPIRVLDCDGNGTTDSVVAGLDAIVGLGISGPKVVNMSLGGGPDATVDAAVKNLVDNAGITVVLAAGNGDEDGKPLSACSVSPARVKTAITVGATTSADKRTSWSNYGSCVDLYAPGQNIWSDWISPDGSWYINMISGTSMAAPHVTGAVAMYLQRHPSATPAQVQAALIKTATPNKVTNVSSAWPRLLLFALQPAVKPVSVTSGNKLKYNQSLVRGNKICSANGAYCLSPEAASGKLVLRKVTGTKKVIWTAGKSVYWTRMTSTGALSSYDGYGRRVWTSKKTGGKATLYVVSSGYLSIKRDSDGKVLWTSKG